MVFKSFKQCLICGFIAMLGSYVVCITPPTVEMLRRLYAAGNSGLAPRRRRPKVSGATPPTA